MSGGSGLAMTIQLIVKAVSNSDPDLAVERLNDATLSHTYL